MSFSSRKLSYLRQDCYQGASQLSIIIWVIERHRPSSVTTTASSPDTVNIFVNFFGEVKVHHMLYIRNIQSTGSYRGRHHDWTLARAKVCQSLLSLPLLTVTVRQNTWLSKLKLSEVIEFWTHHLPMNAGSWNLLLAQVGGNKISLPLGLNKHHGTLRSCNQHQSSKLGV